MWQTELWGQLFAQLLNNKQCDLAVSHPLLVNISLV